MALILMIVGAVNRGLVGLFGFDLGAFLVGRSPLDGRSVLTQGTIRRAMGTPIAALGVNP